MVLPEFVDDRHAVGHPGPPARDRVLDAVEELEPGRGLARREIGVLAQRQAGVRGRVRLDDRLDGEHAAEVRTADRPDPARQFAHELVGCGCPTQTPDPHRAERCEPRFEYGAVVEHCSAVECGQLGHRGRGPRHASTDRRGREVAALGDRPQPTGVGARRHATSPRQFERAVARDLDGDQGGCVGELARFDGALAGRRFESDGLFVQPQRMADEVQSVVPRQLDCSRRRCGGAERPPLVVCEIRRQDHRRGPYLCARLRADRRSTER